MRIWPLSLSILGLLLSTSSAFPVGDGTLLDAMDDISFTAPKDKGQVELVSGKFGKALKFSFPNDCTNVLMTGHVAGKPEWDSAAGFSFWVKGDGSDHLGGIEFIWNGDYATRYACSFPIDNIEWKRVTVPWRDLIPELSSTTLPISPKNGNAPSKLGPFAFGKWWYWKDYAAHSYVIDDIRLEPVITLDNKEYRPAGAPLARTLAKLKAGKPITIVTVGDSLTDTSHWTNRETNWPKFLQLKIKQKYGSDVTLVNPAMGGTELRQNLVVMPRWTKRTPEPDLVTIFFGFNDWNSGMRGDNFQAAQQDAVDRIRRATGGHADVLILTTCPPLENSEMLSELAAACRQAARSKNAGLGDVSSSFLAVPQADRARLYATDKVHLAPPGQERVAQTVLNALEQNDR